jgi:ceramide glucosyltransferase
MIETVLISLAVILLIQSFGSLFGALRFARYSLRAQTPRHHRYQPKAMIILPCKGLEPGLEQNLEAYCNQDYREYDLILVTESEHDPAYKLISKVINQSRRSAWLVVAGEAKERGQKVHNLLAALETLNAVDRRVEILAFADSDARPSRKWLAELVAPLDEKRVGATTGFRWYLSGGEGTHTDTFAGRLRSLVLTVWNASALSVLGERSGFAWGGATALRRELFDHLEMRQRWEGALSDDYVLTAALHETGQRIKFVPAALTASYASGGLRELIEFTTRQMKITRVYAPRIWRFALITNSIFNITLWAGLAWCVWAAITGGLSADLPILLGLVLFFGAATIWIRLVVAARLLKAERAQILRERWIQPLLGPVASALYLANLVLSIGSRQIVWRGIGYELISRWETRVLFRPDEAEVSQTAKAKTSRSKESARTTLP